MITTESTERPRRCGRRLVTLVQTSDAGRRLERGIVVEDRPFETL
jgi:hypothetical protein